MDVYVTAGQCAKDIFIILKNISIPWQNYSKMEFVYIVTVSLTTDELTLMLQMLTFHLPEQASLFVCLFFTVFLADFCDVTCMWVPSGGDDRRVLLWHMEKAIHGRSKPVKLKGEHLSNIFCLAFDSTNRKVFSGGERNSRLPPFFLLSPFLSFELTHSPIKHFDGLNSSLFIICQSYDQSPYLFVYTAAEIKTSHTSSSCSKLIIDRKLCIQMYYVGVHLEACAACC